MMAFQKPSLLELNDPFLKTKGVSVSVLRLDEIHPEISGNKWFKLKYNLEQFRKRKKKILVTAGGAWSNHLRAVAAAGKELNFPSIGIVRGEELNRDSNSLLRFASSCGMKLHFVTREDYRQLRRNEAPTQEMLDAAGLNEDDIYFLPEGGSNEWAVKGCAEIADYISPSAHIVCCACGTGATLAGLTLAIGTHQAALGIAVLQGESFLEKDILKWNGGKKNFSIEHRFHFGGYHATSPALAMFCSAFSERHRIPIEPVYTGKLFYGVMDMIANDRFAPGTKITAIHTGGLHE